MVSPLDFDHWGSAWFSDVLGESEFLQTSEFRVCCMLLHEPSGSVWQVTADPGEAKAHKSYHSFLSVCQILWKVLIRVSLVGSFRIFYDLGGWLLPKLTSPRWLGNHARWQLWRRRSSLLWTQMRPMVRGFPAMLSHDKTEGISRNLASGIL